jgi:hypothetical protein
MTGTHNPQDTIPQNNSVELNSHRQPALELFTASRPLQLMPVYTEDNKNGFAITELTIHHPSPDAKNISEIKHAATTLTIHPCNTNTVPETKEEKSLYTSILSETEIEQLLQKYADLPITTPLDLENIITENIFLYRLIKSALLIGIMSNLAYIGFIKTTGAAGIKLTANLLNPGGTVQEELAETFGIILGALDIVFFLVAISPTTQAIKLLLYCLSLWSNIMKQLCDMASYAYHFPLKAAGHIALETTLLTVNSASMLTVLLGFMDYFTNEEKIALTFLVLVFGNLYISQYSNKDARDGVFDFWLNKDLPWLFSEFFCKKRYSIATEAAFQGMSATTLSALMYYYIGNSIATAFEASPDTGNGLGLYVAVCSALWSQWVMYPISYFHHIQPSQDLRKLIAMEEENVENKIQTTPAKQISYIDLQEKKYEQEAKLQLTYRQSFKDDKPSAVQALFRAAVTVVFGIMSILDPSPTNIILLLACMIFTITKIQSPFHRASSILAKENLASTARTKNPLLPTHDLKTATLSPRPTSKKDKDHWFIKLCAGTLATGAATASFLNTPGTLKTSNLALIYATSLSAFDKLILLLYYNYPKALETLRKIFSSSTCSQHGLFSSPCWAKKHELEPTECRTNNTSAPTKTP